MSTPTLGLHSIEECRPLIGAEAVDRILRKAAKLRDLTIASVGSPQYGGGVPEILSPLVLLFTGGWVERISELRQSNSERGSPQE